MNTVPCVPMFDAARSSANHLPRGQASPRHQRHDDRGRPGGTRSWTTPTATPTRAPNPQAPTTAQSVWIASAIGIATSMPTTHEKSFSTAPGLRPSRNRTNRHRSCSIATGIHGAKRRKPLPTTPWRRRPNTTSTAAATAPAVMLIVMVRRVMGRRSPTGRLADSTVCGSLTSARWNTSAIT